MPNDKLTLSINKINISPDSTRLKYDGDERGRQVDVTVIGNDNATAYDLTDKKIVFSEVKAGGKIIIDDDSTRFIRSTENDKIGKFTYIFPDQAYQQSGEACFEFTTDAEHVDATINFTISIVSSSQLNLENSSYVSSLVGLQTHYQSVVKIAESSTQSLIDNLNGKIQQAIFNGQRDVAGELEDAKSKLTIVLNQEKDLIQNWTAEFTKRKSDFDGLKSNWQRQSQQIQTNYEAKIQQIVSEAQSERGTIQSKADEQLRSNQEANHSLTSRFTSDAQNKLNEIESNKVAAIKAVTDARDRAIQDATDKLAAKLQSVQADYDRWKASTVSDFQGKLDKLTKELSNNESNQTALQQAIDSANEAISKIKDVDWTTYAHKDDLLQGYVELSTEDSKRQRLCAHDGKAISFKKPFIEYDITLSKQGSTADAYAVGQRINDLDSGLTQLNQEIYKNFDTKENTQNLKNEISINAQDLKNEISTNMQDLKNKVLSNADTNRNQDSKISVLQNRASELENNSQTLHLLGHDLSSISSHSRNTFTAKRQFFVNDTTLTNASAYANAKATGDAIKQNYQQLSQAIGIIYAWLENLDNQQVIIDIKNRLSALEEQKKENK